MGGFFFFCSAVPERLSLFPSMSTFVCVRVCACVSVCHNRFARGLGKDVYL